MDPLHSPPTSTQGFRYLTAAQILDRYVLTTTSGLNDECTICQQKYNTGDEPEMPVVLPGCTHIFGARCIAVWMNGGQNSCPMCRKTIFGDGRPTPPPDRAQPPRVLGIFGGRRNAMVSIFRSISEGSSDSSSSSLSEVESDVYEPMDEESRETADDGAGNDETEGDEAANNEIDAEYVDSDETINDGDDDDGTYDPADNDADAMDESEDSVGVSEGSVMHELNSPPPHTPEEDRIYNELESWRPDWYLNTNSTRYVPSRWAAHAEALYSDLCESIVSYLEDPTTPQEWLEKRYPMAGFLQFTTFGQFHSELSQPDSLLRDEFDRLLNLNATRVNMELIQDHIGQMEGTRAHVQHATAETHTRFVEWHRRIQRAHNRHLGTLFLRREGRRRTREDRNPAIFRESMDQEAVRRAQRLRRRQRAREEATRESHD